MFITYDERNYVMKWGTFGVVHITTLLLSVAILVILYLLIKNKSEKTQRILLFILSLSGIAAIIFNLVTWNSPLEYLPFHMCSINAILLPIAIATKNKTIGNLLLVWCLGALLALVVNFAQADFEIFSSTFFFYYFPHTFEFGIPILLFVLGIFHFKPKYILTTVGITAAIYTAVHFINVWLNQYCMDNNILDFAGNVIQVNYMYSIKPENPVLDLFWTWIPHPFWYMLPGVVIVAVYELGLFGIWYIKHRKQK